MYIYLHKSLFDLSKAQHSKTSAKAGQLSGSADTGHSGKGATSEVGGSRPGSKYFAREIDPSEPRNADGSVNYKYFASSEEYEAHLKHKKDSSNKGKGKEDGKDRLEAKLDTEQREHKKPRAKEHTGTLFGKKDKS